MLPLHAYSSPSFLLLTGISILQAATAEPSARNEGSLSPSSRVACTEGEGCSLNTDNLEFFVIGDSGGQPVFPYYSYAQVQVAMGMAERARKGKLQFVINVGDNVYLNGAKNVFDSRFEDSFELVYARPELAVPWYMIGGNHDHLGNITAQIAYTSFSSKWTYPKLFYKVRYSFGEEGGDRRVVEFLCVDTVVLCEYYIGNTADVQGDSLLSWLFSEKLIPSGPPPEYKELAREQLNWIEEQLRDSTADYLFVAGHYPIHSASEHGPIACLQRVLESSLRKYNVTAYFNGHDHNLQHIQINTSEPSTGHVSTMNYIISGASSRSDRSAKHLDTVPSESLLFRYPIGWNPFSQLGFSNGGFVHAELQRDAAIFKFYSGKGELKYETRFPPRYQTSVQ